MNILDKFLCYFLHWHTPGKKQKSYNVRIPVKCKRCKKSIMMDSQGNWF